MWAFVVLVLLVLMQIPDNFCLLDTDAFDNRVVDQFAPLNVTDSIL